MGESQGGQPIGKVLVLLILSIMSVHKYYGDRSPTQHVNCKDPLVNFEFPCSFAKLDMLGIWVLYMSSIPCDPNDDFGMKTDLDIEIALALAAQ